MSANQPEETIDDRKCRKCKLVKPIDQFQKEKRLKYGYSYLCLKCASDQVRGVYRADPIRKLNHNAEYREQNKDKITKRQYEYRALDPVKNKARQAVNNAIAAGKFQKQPCNECGTTDRLHFHHTHGYELDNHFTGVWLCIFHHKEVHNAIRERKRLCTT